MTIRGSHSAFSLVHILAPFGLFFETGSVFFPFIAIVAWEIGEQTYYNITGDYGPLYFY